ncbi:MAG TPA: TetR/AcrR family transcriptional regulator [Kineosporiaceae bacterium]|nr:TetR/AcrR family transcriptional regulator [Kineosporiaceae bacterium]
MPRQALTPDDWAMAALDALARGGVAAVSIEALARELGATRGSFYWHFPNRDAVLTAALHLWERRATDEIIAAAEREPDPRRRLRRLLHDAVTVDPVPGLEPSIAAHAGHPAVAPVLRRVTTRRIDFLARCYAGLGATPALARRQAVLAYAAYLGWMDLRHTAEADVPETAEGGRVAARALAHFVDTLAGPAD